eukprot:SAG31_NODE_5775_length_2332_cov_1.669503_2_plen_252_part_00
MLLLCVVIPIRAAHGVASVPAKGRLGWATPMPPPVVNIEREGGTADNRTSNTKQFAAAVAKIRGAGGGTLLVPKGLWLTGPFNLTSNMTLYLASGAVIQASTDLGEWPLMPPMKSYGQGRDHPGARHVSLLHGFDIRNVVIGGENGTVDGGGPFWWARHRGRTETHTRGHLFECMSCTDLLFQDVVFRNSPFWTVHPVRYRRVVLAPVAIACSMVPCAAQTREEENSDSVISFDSVCRFTASEWSHGASPC